MVTCSRIEPFIKVLWGTTTCCALCVVLNVQFVRVFVARVCAASTPWLSCSCGRLRRQR
jgi:hypothetical protein